MQRVIATWTCALGLLLLPTLAGAASLSKGLETLFGERGVELDVDRSGLPHRSHFTSENLATFGLLTQQLAANAADFPAVGTATGFTYVYDPKLEVFAPSTRNLGSMFVERARTVGRGRFQFGLTYLYLNFDQLDGTDLKDVQFDSLRHNDCCSAAFPPPSPDNPAFERDTADLQFQKFKLRSHAFFLNGTYGVTDWWDVNLLVPVVYTTMDVRAQATLNNESGTGTHFFDVTTGQTVEQRSFDDDALGVGDLLLRTKARVLDSEALLGAVGLVLRVPTGDEEDFQGLGDVTLTPFLAASREFGPVEIHASSGIDIDVEDTDRSRVRYGGGFAWQLGQNVDLMFDVVGSSSMFSNDIHVDVPQFVNAPGTSEATPTTIPTNVRFTKSVSTNIVDVAPGMQIAFGKSVIGFLTFFVPITDDGLRATLVPAGGVQATF
jgi:hypothetical protein